MAHKVALASAAVAILLFMPVLQNGFVAWDDNCYVQENPFIRSLDGELLRESFLKFHARIPNWHPLTFVSHAIDYALWGLDPRGHHLGNVLLHGLNTYLVVLLVARLARVGRERAGRAQDELRTVTGAAVVGLLFAIHPIHVESVAWIAERKDVQYAAFYLLSVLFYLRYAGRAGATGVSFTARIFHKDYLFALFFFVLSLMSKPMAVTLPFVLLIIDWYPLRRIDGKRVWRGLLAEKIPFVLLALGTGMLAVLAARAANAIVFVDPLGLRLMIALESLVRYLGNLVYPYPLLPFYQRPRSVECFSAPFIGSLLVVICIMVLSLWAAWKQQRLWFALWAMFVVMLAPVLGLVEAGEQAMADRFLYLPSLAVFGCVGYGASSLVARISLSPKRNNMVGIAAAVGMVFVALLMLLTILQIRVWHDSVELWSQVIRYKPNAAKAYLQRGNALLDRKEFRQALADFSESIRLAPDNAYAFNDRGVAFAELGLLPEAIGDFTRAIALNSMNPDFFRNRGTAYRLTGQLVNARRDFQQAEAFQ